MARFGSWPESSGQGGCQRAEATEYYPFIDPDTEKPAGILSLFGRAVGNSAGVVREGIRIPCCHGGILDVLIGTRVAIE